MIRVGSRSQGYTIVETIIFLAVTGVLFLTSLQLVSDQQGKTEFNQAVNDIRTQIQDVANDVSTGFYHNPLQFQCQASLGFSPVPIITPFGGAGTDTQGTNQDCIFIGRVVQYAATPATTQEKYVLYSVVGLRKSSTGKEVSTYAEAIPTAIAKGSGAHNAVPDGSQEFNMPGGVKAFSVRYINAGVPTNVAGFGFMSTLAQYSLGVVASGTKSIDIVAVGVPTTPPSPAQNKVDFVDNIDNFNTVGPMKNPDGGFVLCFDSGTSRQHAVITFGVNKNLTPKAAISDGPASSDGQCI
jgi:hypothetical protein